MDQNGGDRPPSFPPKKQLFSRALGCSAVGTSAGAVDQKTYDRKWVWAFIDAITERVDIAVIFLQREDGADCCIFL